MLSQKMILHQYTGWPEKIGTIRARDFRLLLTFDSGIAQQISINKKCFPVIDDHILPN